MENVMLSLAQIEVIINAGSGADDKEEAHKQLAEIFKSHGSKANINLANSGAEVIELAQRAARGSSQIIVAGGGDGTINAVAAELVGTEKILGVLPLGTFNHFAKDLLIPLDLESAVGNLFEGQVVKVDVGTVNDRVFINNSSLGLYPHLVRQREKKQRSGLSKWSAFLWSAFIVLRRYPLLSVRLEVDGQEFHHRTPFVFIGNNEYTMNFFDVGSRGCLDAGELSLYIAPLTGRLGMIRLALRALFGRLNEAKDFTALCAKEIWVETRRKLGVATDGEVFVMESPLHYKVQPGALRVIVPLRESAENPQ
jgi:YegS/Rv2252/BmrU family lipid kinase